jgi:regulator of protease activity HflC (stomatin/prohibitin superfamily)
MAYNPIVLCCSCTAFIVAIVLMGVSFATIGPLHAGLRFDTIMVKYDFDMVYKSGRYAVGPGRSIDAFPQTWQTLMFCSSCNPNMKDTGPVSSKAAGAGGSPVNVDLEVFLYYKLKVARLPQLIRNFPTKNYHSKFVRVATTAIKNVIQRWTVNEMLEERERLAHEIGLEVNAIITPEGAYVVACYLGTVGLQQSSDTAYLEQWVAIRRKLTSEVRGEVLKIRQSTEAEVSKERKEKDVLLSKQYQVGNTTIEQKKAAGEELILKAQGTAYRALQQRLNFTQTQLLKYIYYEKIRSTKASLIAGFSDNDKLLST